MKITNGTGINAANYSQMQNANNTNQDSQLKSIQKQIENVQQQLQNLSNNEEMSMEEKMNIRKELQQQLLDLNRQMSQRKMEIQQERWKKSTAKAEKQETVQRNSDKQEFNVIGTTTVQGIISADASMKQVKTVQSTKTNMEGKAGVLESEIKMDKGRGGSTESKEAELKKLNDRINNASADMMDKISDIGATLEKSREENERKDEEYTDKNGIISQKERLLDLEVGETTTETAKNTGNPNTTQTQSPQNIAKSKVSSNLSKGQHVDVEV